MFYDTFNSIGNAHLVVCYLIIGANLFLKETKEYEYTFRKMDYIVILVLKCAVFPFLGVIFAVIAKDFHPDNKVLLYTAFLQWFLPTSIDLIVMVQSKEVNYRDVSIIMALQWLIMVTLMNFIVMPAIIKAIDLPLETIISHE